MSSIEMNRPNGAAPANPTAATKPPAPIRWRQAVLTFIAVYPVITLYIYAIFPLTDGWEIWQRTLLLAPLMVLTIVYGIAPWLQKRFGGYIMGKAPLLGRK